MTGGRLLTAREVTDRLGVSTETVLRWVRRGTLPAIKLPSGQIRFRPDELDAWLADHSTSVVDQRLTVIRGEQQHA